MLNAFPFRKLTLLCLLLFPAVALLPAQNLVPNPSFETPGPYFCGWITIPASYNVYVPNWTCPTNGTPDFHSTQVAQSCWNFQPNSTYSGFECWRGPQMPRTGDRMAALFTMVNPTSMDWREYIQVQLTSPMVPGVKYDIEFYTSLADYSAFRTNNLGAYLSTTPVNMGINWNLPFTPQINSTSVISNTTGWTQIHDTLTPTQPYQYLIIGNFYDTPATTFQSNGGGCSGAYYYIDDVRISPVDTVLRDTTICLGDSAILCTTWSDSLWWSTLVMPNDTIDTTACLHQQPFMTTDYIVHKPSGNDTVTVFVIMPPPPPTLPPDTTLCSGPILLQSGVPPAPGFVYSWVPGGQSSMDITASTAGSYEVTVSNGCFSLTDTIYVYPTPYVDLGPDTTLCQGDSLHLFTQYPLLPNLWSTGQTGNSIYAHPPGTFWVEVSHPHCGPVRDTIVINEIIPPAVPALADTFVCTLPVIRTLPVASGLSYLWSSGDTTESDTFNAPGTYWYQATHFCVTYRDTFDVQYAPPVVVNLGNDTSICQGTSLTLNAGNPGSTYSWNTGPSTQMISVNTSGTYSVIVTGLCNSDEDSITISIDPLPPAVNIADVSICPGNSATFDIGPQTDAVLWSTGAASTSISTTNGGLVWVSLTNGCGQTRDSATVTLLPWVDVNLPADTTLCPGATFTLDAGNPGAGYSWNMTPGAQTFTVTSAGTYLCQVTGPCNSDQDAITVSPGLMPFVFAGNDTLLCGEKGLTLFAQYNGDDFFWQDNSTDPNYNVSQTGWYWATASTQCGTAVDSIHVWMESYPWLDLGPDQELCEGSTAILQTIIPQNMNFTWEDNSSVVPRSITISGIYSGVMNNVCGNAFDTVAVNFHPLPIVDLGEDNTICDDESQVLNAGPGYASYYWTGGITTQTLNATAAGMYWVSVTDSFGCVGSDTFWLDMIPCFPFMPNAFSPNGDGRNERFAPVSFPERVVDWQVFDRWGKLIFATSSALDSWDGAFLGSPCPEGVYMWRGTFRDAKGNQKQLAGSVTLMR